MKTRINFIVVLILSLGCNCFAQTLTLQDAIKSAIDKNEDIAIQENNLEMALFKVKEAYAGLLPTVEGYGQFKKRKGGQFIEQQAQFVKDALTDNFYGSIDANLTLFNGFNKQNSIKQSKHLRDASTKALKRTKQDIVLQVSTAYLECLVNKELKGILENNLLSQKEILKKVKEEAKLGARPEIDFLLQQSEVEKIQLELLKAKGLLKTSKLKLSSSIGTDPNTDFDIIEPLYLSESISNAKTLDTTAIDYQNRPDYLQLQSNIKASKNKVRIQSSGLFPNLSAFYSYNSGYNSGYIDDFSQQLDGNLLNEYGLSLTVPIFSGLRNKSARKQAIMEYDNAVLANQKLKRQIKQEILQAVQNYKEALQEDTQAEKQLEYAEEVFALETERLQLGMSDVERYSRATEAIIQSRATRVQAKYKLLFQKLFLEYAMGTLKSTI